GNGLRFWEEFWIRREFNPDCTNLEALRPRLVYMSNCANVTVQDVRLINSPFWTNHLYKCHHVRYLDCYIFAPTTGVRAPSSDALDIDFCHDILVDGCYMSVNDDAVVLKGGKGTYADMDPDNGPNYNVVVQNCTYGKVHGCLTLGSESLHDWNVILRNCTVDNVDRVLWLKMRPDTPQHYEHVRVENVSGTCVRFLVVRPWTQFYNLLEREDMPVSECNDICIKDIDVVSENFFDVGSSDKYVLRDFSFGNCKVEDGGNNFDPTLIGGIIVDNLVINGSEVTFP
ncbi:MAG: glycosyl hydrolase family 28 protein, partial [Bacteroidales bacterium]|nr:glycosyl hydrolase family 28 protein [Bacteroidales bacterium]